MKRTRIAFVLVLLCCIVHALPDGWMKPEGYAYTMSVFAQVLNENGVPVVAEGSALAVFDGAGNCRGMAAVRTNAQGVTLFQISVSSDAQEEEGLRLRVYDAARD